MLAQLSLGFVVLYWLDSKLIIVLTLFLVPLSMMQKLQPSLPATSNDIHPDVRYRRWGIYTVAFDKPQSCGPSVRSITDGVARVLREDVPPAGRLIAQLFRMAPVAFSIHVLCTVWMGIAPALYFYLSSIILTTVSVHELCKSCSLTQYNVNRWKPI
jgi:hypothetical protein